jgi:hypothetical protein
VAVQLQQIANTSGILKLDRPGASVEKLLLLCLIVAVIGVLAELSPVLPPRN